METTPEAGAHGRDVNTTHGLIVGSPSATFMRPTRVWNPRQLQFAARYRF